MRTHSHYKTYPLLCAGNATVHDAFLYPICWWHGSSPGSSSSTMSSTPPQVTPSVCCSLMLDVCLLGLGSGLLQQQHHGKIVVGLIILRNLRAMHSHGAYQHLGTKTDSTSKLYRLVLLDVARKLLPACSGRYRRPRTVTQSSYRSCTAAQRSALPDHLC